MSGNFMENNCTSLSGKIASKPEFSHEIYGEGFYLVMVEVSRLSNTYDLIPVMFSERLMPLDEFLEGKTILVEGQFRSYNNYSTESSHKLLLTVFARDIVITDTIDEVKVPNSVFLKVSYVKGLYIEQPRLDVKLPTFFLRLTVLIISPITYPVLPGEETHASQAILK